MNESGGQGGSSCPTKHKAAQPVLNPTCPQQSSDLLPWCQGGKSAKVLQLMARFRWTPLPELMAK
eukprot:1150457-Pelagomonas_calceolata.AAC.4